MCLTYWSCLGSCLQVQECIPNSSALSESISTLDKLGHIPYSLDSLPLRKGLAVFLLLGNIEELAVQGFLKQTLMNSAMSASYIHTTKKVLKHKLPKISWFELIVCVTCKGTALVLAVENDGRLCFEECPDCNSAGTHVKP